MRAKEIVHRFLASMGRPEATEQYLRLYQAEAPERFALVVVTARALQESSSAVVADLVFLRELELTPVLCLPNQDLATELISQLPSGFGGAQCAVRNAATVATSRRIPIVLTKDAGSLQATAKSLCPRKIVYLIGQSGLQPQGEEVRSLINMRTDYDGLVAAGGLRTEQAHLLDEVRGLFEACDHTFTVSLTSAQDLLRELFTVKGAGTLVRRGTKVEALEGFNDLERVRFSGLLSSAFGRTALDGFFDRPALVIYLASQYQGAAVLEASPLAPYLSKFAVDIRAQGEGIGGDLWRAMTRDHERFFWRSRPDNPIAGWYASKCDGLVRGEEWTVYWRGLQTSEISQAVDLAGQAPIDFGAAS